MEVVSSFLVVGKDGCDVKCIRSRLLLNIHSIYPNSTTTTSEAGRKNCQCVKRGKKLKRNNSNIQVSSSFLLTCTAAAACCGFSRTEETKLVFGESLNKTNCRLQDLANTCNLIFGGGFPKRSSKKYFLYQNEGRFDKRQNFLLDYFLEPFPTIVNEHESLKNQQIQILCRNFI